MTPILLDAREGLRQERERFRPPLTICSVRSAILTVSTLKTRDENTSDSAMTFLLGA